MAPGEERILAELHLAEENNRKGLSYGELRQKTGLSDSILSEYVRRLQNKDRISRMADRKYRINEAGRQALDKTDTIQVISRTPQMLRREVEITPDMFKNLASAFPSRVLPIQGSVYQSAYAGSEATRKVLSQFTRMTEELEEDLDRAHLERTLIEESAKLTGGLFDNLLFLRFLILTTDWILYRVQKMNPQERKKFLRREFLRGVKSKEELQRRLNSIERQIVALNFPEDGPHLTLDNILDFETAVVLRISAERTKKDVEKLRYRLAAFLLGELGPLHYREPDRWPSVYVEGMARAGIITDKDARRFIGAREGSAARSKLFTILWNKYYTLAFGRD
jgi:DNA-binding HxlR family transcriptional regulator